MASGFADLIGRAADPLGVRAAIDALIQRNPDLRSRLDHDLALARRVVAVTAASHSLSRLLLRDPLAIDVLADLDRRVVLAADEPAGRRQEAGLVVPREDGEPHDLERWKQLAYLRIAARDLTGRDGLDATAEALADLAAEVLDRAAASVGGDAGGLAVIGMGKLGGSELNYASDIDVLFVADGDIEDGRRRARSIIDIARRCFRVDTSLRPEGRDGPLVRSVESYVAYWERWAEPWEFQALLKARPVAGDPALGQRWLRAAEDHLWTRPFSADDLRAVRAMKQKAEAAAANQGTAEHELKRAPGGIRDVEFAAQLLQLVHGQHDPRLRCRRTVDALRELGEAGYVDHDDAAWLIHAYRFLRRIEHAVQLDEERQIHTVPDDPRARQRIARIVGFRDTPREAAVDAFDRELAACRATVRTHHEQLWFRPLLEQFARVDGPLAPNVVATRLAAFGFTDVERTRQAVVELTRGLTRSSRLMQQMLPLLLEWLSESPDPDLGLLSLRRLVAEREKADRVVGVFRDSPIAARRICHLLGTSRRLGEVLALNTDMVADLGATCAPRALPALLADARAALAWRAGEKARTVALRRFRDREMLRIAAADVLDQATPDEVGEALSALADAVVIAAAETLQPDVPFAVIAMGRFGGRALSYASDLDLLFLYEPGGAPAAAAAEAATRMAARLVRLLRGATPAEQVWDVDLDLRPEGRDGPLVRSLDSYAAYVEHWAQTWERQAATQARPVVGPPELLARFDAILTAWLARGLEPPEARDIRRMKARVERERIPAGQDPEFHLKLGRGSLSDVEWTVQLLQLQHGLRCTGTTETLRALQAAGAIEAADAAALEDAYRFCERTRNRLFLTDGPSAGDSLPTKPERLAVLARSLDTNATGLREDYRRVTRRARRTMERLFYGHT